MTGITYRSEKGAPLTAAEVDDNFRALDEELQGLMGTALLGESVAHIAVDGDQLLVTGSQGTSFPAVTLPTPQPRGAWQESILYHPLDMVHFEGDGYLCRIPHFSGDFATDLGFDLWVKVVERGQTGEAVNWRGDWQDSTDYDQGDGVTQGEDLYVALAENTDQPPPEAGIWRRIGPAHEEAMGLDAAIFLLPLFPMI